jgi:DNA invertase Pin-like site-specific DNA recombinase
VPIVWGYVRVSDVLQLGRKAMQDGKVIDDTSLDTQKHVILSWWQRNRKLYPDHEFASDEHGVPVFFEDPAQSASKIPLAQRPQGMHLMASCSPGDIIVVMDTDRVFRDTSDTLTTMAILKYRGVKLVSVNCPAFGWDTPDEVLVGTVLAAVAQRESAQLGRRISMHHHSREERGLVSNNFVPLGYLKKQKLLKCGSVVKYFEPCEAERWWLRIFRHLNEEHVFVKDEFQRMVADSDHWRRGHKGSRGKWTWAQYRVSGIVVSRNFPPNQLVNARTGYRRDRISASEVPTRRRPARAAPVKRKRALPEWAATVWQGRPKTSAVAAILRQQYLEQSGCPAAEASPGLCS